jgi:fatty acid desaturase/ferredoxin
MIKVGVEAYGIDLGALVRVRNHRFQKKLAAAVIANILLAWAVLSTSWVVSVIPMILLGLLYAHFVELQHQCLHNTAYRSKGWNRFVGVLLGLPTLVSFSDYQFSHMRHHRLLGTRQDKEFFNYDYKTLTTFRNFIPHLFMVPHHKDVARSIVASALGRLGREGASPKVTGRIRTEYLIMAAALLAMTAVSVWFQTFIFVKLWLLPLLVAIPAHTLIELPEHFGCDKQTTDVLSNTRTIKAGRAATWFTNGNNYHVEHHWMPAVPNDRFVELHRSLGTNIRYLETSYWSFFKKFSMHLLGRGGEVEWLPKTSAPEEVVSEPAEEDRPAEQVFVTDQVFSIEQGQCIRCASCSSIAPTVFYVGDSTASILRQPLDGVELDRCEAALGNCPTSAITVSTRAQVEARPLVEITRA